MPRSQSHPRRWAVWIWSIADREFPGHRSDRRSLPGLWAAAGIRRQVFSTSERRKKRRASHLQSKLDKGCIESIVKQLRAFSADQPAAAERVINTYALPPVQHHVKKCHPKIGK